MKRFLLILMTCLIGMPALTAKAKPFGKGTIYLNFSLGNTTSSQIKGGSTCTVLTGAITIDPPGEQYEKYSSPPEFRSFSRIAKVFTLEYGLSSNLGLEFQLQNRSGDSWFYHEHAEMIQVEEGVNWYKEYVASWCIPGHFNQFVSSIGANYHMDFIKVKGLDIYTGLQIGIEEMNISIFDFILEPEIAKYIYPDYPNEFFENLKNVAEAKSSNQTYTLIYSHFAVGARYFISDRVALQARYGLKVSFAGWPSTFFYSAGLTVEL